MDYTQVIFGILIGSVVVWYLLRSKSKEEFQKGKTDSLGDVNILEERLSGRDEKISGLEKNITELVEKNNQVSTENTDLKTELGEINATMKAEKKANEEKLKLIDKAEKALSDTFNSLSSEALKSNNKAFLELANESLNKFQELSKNDLKKRQTAINDLVKPIRESLKDIDKQVQGIEKTREGAYQSLLDQVKSMSISQKDLQEETTNLVQALRAPVVRGRWGEIQLKNVVEMAGMLNRCDFFEQESVSSDSGRLRPDMIINLPGGRTIVVDAKTPLSAYLDSVDESDDEKRLIELKKHAKQVKGHIKTLSKKNYWDQFKETPEFVIMFIPGESFYSAALQQDPTLIEIAVEQKVVIATPTTLITLLRTVNYGWRQDSLSKNATIISELGKDLYSRISTLGEHMSNLGKGLTRSVDHYNKAVSTLESRVLVSARKFIDLDAAPSNSEINPVTQIEKVTRSLSADELKSLPAPDKKKKS